MEEKKDWIQCRKCGDEVEMPLGKVLCWECIEDTSPTETDI